MLLSRKLFLSCVAPEVKCLRLLPVWEGDRQRWTGILGSRVDRAVPEAAPLFVAEKEENWREERSMARQRV